jgi:hypothetical protein
MFVSSFPAQNPWDERDEDNEIYMSFRAEGIASQTCRVLRRLICLYFTSGKIKTLRKRDIGFLQTHGSSDGTLSHIGHEFLSHCFSSEERIRPYGCSQLKGGYPILVYAYIISHNFTYLSTNGLQKLFDARLSMSFHDSSMDVVEELLPNHTVSTPPPSLKQTVDCGRPVMEGYLQKAETLYGLVAWLLASLFSCKLNCS